MREDSERLKLCKKNFFEDSGKFGSVKLLMKKTDPIYTNITGSNPTVRIEPESTILWLGFDSGTWRQSQNWD